MLDSAFVDSLKFATHKKEWFGKVRRFLKHLRELQAVVFQGGAEDVRQRRNR